MVEFRARSGGVVRRTILVATAAALTAACGTGNAVKRGGEKVGEGLGDAVAAPLEDLNLKRDKIPAVLTEARTDPYGLKGLTRCEAIAAQVGRLDEALGPDVAEPKAPDSRTRVEKGADAGADAALGAVRGTTTDFIPFRSWVRRLTGAEKHSRLVRESIDAGMIRRGYLKGVGMRMNCAPPAAPSWFVPTTPKRPAAPPKPPRR